MSETLTSNPAADAGEDSAKRRQIVDGAREIFLAKGFDAASMMDIAKAAGVSKGTLYVYFKDKDELFSAIVQGECAMQEKGVFDFDNADHDVEAVLLTHGKAFVQAIADREAKSEKIQSSFVGIDKVDIVAAEMKGSEAHVTLRVVSELISATRDKAGAVIDGDPETVAEVKDVWTFARDTRSRDPNWKLVATEAED